MRAAGRVLGIAVLAIVLAACGSTPDRSATASPSPGVAVTPTPAPSSTPTATPTLTESPRASASPVLPSGGSVVEDPSLLSILPADIEGVPVRLEDQAFTEAASDPAFATNVARAAFAVVVDANDLASGVVASLRPGTWSDAFFRDWRDTYDKGACGQAGGVVGNAEAELGGRTVYITSCAGGLLVYHAYLEARDVIVSLISVGDRRFGEHLVSDLRP